MNLLNHFSFSLYTLPTTFFLNAGGLFDFDLTFLAEAILFILLAIVVTFSFLSPISVQLSKRNELINFNLRKASILITYGYNQLSTCVELLTEELSELNRQLKLTQAYTNSTFEEEILAVQTKNIKIISQFKGNLAMNSAFLLANINKELLILTDRFFALKFKN